MRDDFLNTLPLDAVVVEAGAYHGEDTVHLAAQCAFVHAFEPVSTSEVRTAVRGLKNVCVWDRALGAECGEEDIWVSGGPHTASSSLLEPKDHLEVLPNITFGERKTVQVITLDSLNIGKVDGLWLDMQGMELAVMKAAPKTMAHVKSIVLEASHRPLYKGCPLWPEVREWIEAEGFQIIKEIDQGYAQTDVLVTRD